MQNGLTALHKATVTGQLGCIRVLLEFNADPRIVTTDGLTAMHLAAWKAQREAIRLLSTRHVPVNEAARDGSTPLHEAVRSGDDSTVSLLLQLGADPRVEDKVQTAPRVIAATDPCAPRVQLRMCVCLSPATLF
jgi:ankyrin repeat protein